MSETQTKDVVPTMVTLNEGPQLPAVREAVRDALRGSEPPRDASAPPAIIPEQTAKNIAIAITSVMSKVGVVEKHGVNRFHNYKYAAMQDIMQKLTPLMAKYGIAIIPTEVGRSMFDNDRAIGVEYEFTIVHTSGDVWPQRPRHTGVSRCRDSRGNFDDKAFNKCFTAARKYFFLALFNIATGDEELGGDADADADKTPSRPIPKHDAETGEIDDVIPEWDDAKRDPAYSPPVPKVAADRAGAARTGASGAAPAETTPERLGRLRNRLAIAAESGTEELRKMWLTIDPPDQRLLEADLRSIYQPRAADITAAQNLL